MVYRKGTLKVLLGPEHLQGDDDPDTVDTTDSHVIQIKPQSRKPNEPSHGYGKIGETNVYKRTRPYQAALPRPRLDRYPSGLELSGQKVEKDEDKTKSARSVRSTISTKSGPRVRDPESQTDTARSEEKESMERDSDMLHNKQADNGYKLSLQRNKASRMSANSSVSKYFLTDFGFRSERTDTFSGHHRRRGVGSAEIERQMEEKAEKHIRTCQIMGNVKRSSKAQMGYEGLRHAVSPTHSPNSLFLQDSRQQGLKQRDFFRSENNLNKPSAAPYMIQLRKSLGSISRTKAIGQSYQRQDPLPAISCRTLIVGSGFGF